MELTYFVASIDQIVHLVVPHNEYIAQDLNGPQELKQASWLPVCLSP